MLLLTCHNQLVSKKVVLHCNTSIKGFSNVSLRLFIDSFRNILCNLVTDQIFAFGYRPNFSIWLPSKIFALGGGLDMISFRQRLALNSFNATLMRFFICAHVRSENTQNNNTYDGDGTRTKRRPSPPKMYKINAIHS